MWVCPAAPTSDRRYEYIEYENGKTLGQKQYCTRGTTKVDSWWRYLIKMILLNDSTTIIFCLTLDIYSGTAVIASAFVMNKERNLTDTSI